MSNAQQAPKHSRMKPERRPNEQLKAQRLKKNWTQVYVATMIGTSDVEVSRWETGGAEPSLYFREKMCALFGTTPEALPSNGALIVYDAIIDDDRRENAAGLLMSLNMLIQTRGGFDYTGADCASWMREVGFRHTSVEHLTGPESMVVGIK